MVSLSCQPTVVHMLDAAARKCPDHVALKDSVSHLSYADFARSINVFANELLKVEVAGGRVMIFCKNSIEFPVALFGIYAAGGQAVPVNPMYTRREFREIVADCSPTAVIVDESLAAMVRPDCLEFGIKQVIETGHQNRSLLSHDTSIPARIDQSYLPDETTLANLMYTGGTTGRPKGVNLTHAQMATNLYQRDSLVPLEVQAERILCFMPMSHSFAMHCCVQGAIHTHNTLIIQEKYHPRNVLDCIQHERVTCLPAGPTALVSLLGFDGFEEYDLSSLKLVISGSAALPVQILQSWERLTSSTVCEGYGQTEAGPVLTYNPRNGIRKSGTVGVALPDTVLRIVDDQNDEVLSENGAIGEICATGPQIMQGYRQRPEENAIALREGWLYTGDIGYFDEDDYLTICDRKKDMVIVSGFNVYPREINEILIKHPGILEAATVGVPDSYRGEVIHSFVTSRQSTQLCIEKLVDHCKANLAPFKVPSSIHVLDTLPKTSVGKIDLVALRAQLS